MSSVADPGCYPGSWFLPVPGLGSWISDLGSWISDPKTSKKGGVKQICCHTIFCSHKFHKIVNYFIFEMLKKIMWANFQRIIELFTPKIVKKLSKIWVWNPGSGNNRIQGSKRHRIPDPDPLHWSWGTTPVGQCLKSLSLLRTVNTTYRIVLLFNNHICTVTFEPP